MEYKVPNLYPKQEEFCKSKTKYTCYGGARGGGKSFVARIKAILRVAANSNADVKSDILIICLFIGF